MSQGSAEPNHEEGEHESGHEDPQDYGAKSQGSDEPSPRPTSASRMTKNRCR